MDETRTEETDALQAALAETERLRAELTAVRAEGALRDALLRRGAMPEAVALLGRAVDPAGVALTEGGSLAEEDALLAPLEARYGFLFRRETPAPTGPLAPPVSGAPALTREDIRRMSAEEINRNWDAVREALMG